MTHKSRKCPALIVGKVRSGRAPLAEPWSVIFERNVNFLRTERFSIDFANLQIALILI